MNIEIKKESLLGLLNMGQAEPQDVEQGRALLPQLSNILDALNQLPAAALFALGQIDSISQQCQFVCGLLASQKRASEFFGEGGIGTTTVENPNDNGESQLINSNTGETIMRTSIDPEYVRELSTQLQSHP